MIDIRKDDCPDAKDFLNCPGCQDLITALGFETPDWDLITNNLQHGDYDDQLINTKRIGRRDRRKLKHTPLIDRPSKGSSLELWKRKRKPKKQRSTP